jgi:hypothetical protein
LGDAIMSDSEMEQLRLEVHNGLRAEFWWTKVWSIVHHTFLFGAVVLSAAAALAIEADLSLWGLSAKRTGSVIAALASIAGGMAAAGGFQRKWRTNRRTRSRLRDLKRDLTDPALEPAVVRARLATIWDEHNTGISGEKD